MVSGIIKFFKSARLRRIKVKLTLTIALLVMLVTLSIYIYFPVQIKKQAVQMIMSKARSVAEMAVFNISPAVFFTDPTTVNETLNDIARNQDIVYMVACDESGKVLAGLHMDKAERLHYTRVDGEEDFFGKGSEVYRLTQPILFQNQRIGQMYIGFSVHEVALKIRESRRTVALVSFLVFLAGLFLAAGISTVITAPLVQISKAANAISEGDFSQRALVYSNDEIGQLARSFNSMVGRLHTAYGALETLTRSLEQRVRERTSELESEIAERMKTEATLRKTYSQLHTLIQAIPESIHFKDLQGRILIFNAAFAKLASRKPSDITGKTVDEVLPKQMAETCHGSDAEVLKKRKATRHAEKFPTGDGQFQYFETIKVPLLDESGKIQGLVAVSRDVTEQKLMDEEKRKIEIQLLQAQKMEAVGVLAGGIAHDFNNLLTAIIGSAEMGLRNIGKKDPLYQDLSEILHAGERAAELTRQLLYFSRKQHMQFTTVRLDRLIEGLFKMFHRLIGEDISIFTDLEPDPWTVNGDVGTLEQVIMNLVVNARDAMPKGGNLTIKTENLVFDQAGGPLFPDAKPGKYVRLSVSDTGVGMDKEIQQHIFEPFFTTKSVGKGTGLGLSVVYGIIKQHGGWVSVYSEPGVGSTFKIYLPAAVDGKATSPKIEKAVLCRGKDLRGGGERILIIEDEKRLCDFLQRALTESGYIIFAAHSADEALRMFEEEKRQFHLVLSDVVLPGRGGLELMEELLSKKPDLKVLLSSGYTDHKNQWPVIMEKGFRFLQKPYNLDDLLKVIRESL
jgi:PAS domain S-box-containing protein